MTQTEQFEIDKKDLEKKLTQQELDKLKKLISNKSLYNKEVFLKEKGGNLYLIDGNNGILIEDKQLKQDIESIRKQEQKEKQQITKKTQQQLGQKKQEVSLSVDLPSQNIETLEKLYNDKDFSKKVILDLIKEKLSKASFDEKIKFLERNKDKGLELFYYGLIEIIKSVKGKEQANEIIQIVGKEQIKKAIKEYILIDDSFAEDYWFYYNSDRFSVSCEGKNVSMETCKSVGAYIWALGGGAKQGVDMNSMSYILFESFGKDISDFANTIETGISFYKKLKGTVPNISKKILKKEGVMGLIRNTLSKTPMSESKKGFWTGMAQIGAMVGVIWGLIKIIKKNGFKGVIGLIAGEFALEAWSGDTSLDLLNKLLYGGFDLDKLSKKGLKKGKENKEYAKLIGHSSLINALVGNMKASELKKYCKFENGKLVSFDIKKYSDSLGKNDWRKALLEKIGVDKAGKIFVLGFSQMGLKSENDFGDKKVGAVYKKYLEGIEEKAKQNQASSNGTQIGTSANGTQTVSSAGGAVTNGLGGTSTTLKPKQIEATKQPQTIFQRVGYEKNGTYYLIGPDGKPKVFTYDTLSTQAKEKLKDYKDKLDFIDDMMFFVQACDKNEGNSSISKKIEKVVKEWYKDPSIDIKTKIEKVLEHTKYFYTDIYNIFKNNIKGEERKLAIYKVIRDDLGEYEMVSSKIAKEEFDKVSKFTNEDISTIYTDFQTLGKDDLISKIKSYDTIVKGKGLYNRIYYFLGGDNDKIKDFVDNMYKKYNEAEKYLADSNNHKLILEQAKNYIGEDKYNNLPNTEKKKIIEHVKKIYRASIFDLAFKKSVLETYIEKKVIKDSDGELGLYKDIEGIGWDDVADSTWDFGKEAGYFILTEAVALAVGAVTAGVGFEAVNALVWGARGYKGIKWAQRIAESERWIARGARFAGKNGLEGALFYEGTNTVQNIFEGKKWFEGAGDGKEILKSMVMMGVLNGLGKLVEKVPGLKSVETDGKLPKIIKLTGKISLEGIAIGAGFGAYDVIIEGKEWNKDMLIEGLMMAAAYRLMGGVAKNLRLRLGKDGEPELGFKKPSGEVAKLNERINERINQRGLEQMDKKIKDIDTELLRRNKLNDYYDPKFRKQRIGEIQSEIKQLKIKEIKTSYKAFIKNKDINNILQEIKNKKNSLKTSTDTKIIKSLKKDIKKLKEQLYEELSKKVFIKEREILKTKLNVKNKDENLEQIETLKEDKTKFLSKRKVLTKSLNTSTTSTTSEDIDFSGLKITKNDFETPYKIELNVKDIKIGYDKSTKKYFVKEGENIMEFNNEKNLNTYLEKNSDIKSKLEEEHLLRKFNESYKKEGLYTEKITGKNYFKGKEFNIDGKDYIVVKKGEKDEFYVVEKDGKKFKFNEKKSIDDFIKEHPEFVENYVKLVDTLYSKAFEKMKNVKISSLSEGKQNKILKALGKPDSWIKDKTIGNLLKGLGDIKSGLWKNWTSKEKGLISKGVDTALIPIKRALTGKINPTIGEGTKSTLKGLAILGGVYSVEYGMQNHDDNWDYVILNSILHGYTEELDGLAGVTQGNYDTLIDLILWNRTVAGAVGYDYYKSLKDNEEISSK